MWQVRRPYFGDVKTIDSYINSFDSELSNEFCSDYFLFEIWILLLTCLKKGTKIYFTYDVHDNVCNKNVQLAGNRKPPFLFLYRVRTMGKRMLKKGYKSWWTISRKSLEVVAPRDRQKLRWESPRKIHYSTFKRRYFDILLFSFQIWKPKKQKYG